MTTHKQSQALRLFVFLFALATIFSMYTGSAKAQGVPVFVNDKRLDNSGVILNGNTLVPMRSIFQALGAEVKYDPATRAIKATKGSTTIDLTLGEKSAYVNGAMKSLTTPAAIIGTTTMVPLRFISDAMGAKIKWDTPTHTAYVYSNEGDNAVSNPAPKVTSVTISPRRELSAGDTLTVVVRGDSDCTATFDILGLKKGIAMREIKEGRYEGEYKITRRCKADRAVIVCHLERNGNEASMEAGETLTIVAAKHNPATVTSNPTTTEEDTGVFCNLTSPSNGASVTSTLTISGKATAGAEVTITIKEESNNLLSTIVNLPSGRTLEKTIVANRRGNFSTIIDLSNVKEGHKVNITCSAKKNGETTSPINITVTRK